MIRLAMVSRPLSDADMRLAKQMGMTDVVTTMPGVTMAPKRVQGPAWNYVDLLHLRKRVEAAGLTLSGDRRLPALGPHHAGDAGARRGHCAGVRDDRQHGTGRHPDLLLQLHGGLQLAAHRDRRARTG